MNLSIVILTYNEEENLPYCLRSVQDIGCPVFVVDSGSTDKTKEIALQYGATLVEHSFESHSKQWEWAFQNLSITTEWVFGLDADQYITQELKEEIDALFAEENTILTGIDGCYVKRRQIFRGKWIQHGGYYPKYLLKLFRRTKVQTDKNELVDHHFYVTGRVAKLKHDLIEENKKENDISFWIDKHSSYAALMASEELQRRDGHRQDLLSPALFGNPDQRILLFKQMWGHCPLYIRPFLYFLYRYFLRLGFLDGKVGFIFHFLQAFWFRLLVDIKLEELRREKRGKLEVGSPERGARSREHVARS